MDTKKFENLLSAYLDGELTEHQCCSVEEWLEEEGAAAILDEFRKVRQCLRDLPQVGAPSGFEDAMHERLEQVEARGKPRTHRRWRNRRWTHLLHAYLDGELGPSICMIVERKLERSTAMRQALREFESVRTALKVIPRHSAPVGLVEQICARLELERPQPTVISAPATEAESTGGRGRWIAGFGMTAAAAAMIFFAGNLGFLALPVDDEPTLVTLDTSDTLVSPVDAPPIASTAAHTLRQREGIEALHRELDRRSKRNTLAGNPDSRSGVSDPDPLPETPDTTTVAADAFPARANVAESGMREGAAPFNLPVEQLAKLRPGELIDLNRQEVKLVCVDVERVANRMRVILADHRIPAFITNTVAQGAADQTGKHMYVIDIGVTPHRLQNVFADLAQEERRTPLIAKIGLEATEFGTFDFEPSQPLAKPEGEHGLVNARESKTRGGNKARRSQGGRNASDQARGSTARANSAEKLGKSAGKLTKRSIPKWIPLHDQVRVVFVLEPAKQT